jgi:hypothetical protein
MTHAAWLGVLAEPGTLAGGKPDVFPEPSTRDVTIRIHTPGPPDQIPVFARDAPRRRARVR